jgi:hypothetical protein
VLYFILGNIMNLKLILKNFLYCCGAVVVVSIFNMLVVVYFLKIPVTSMPKHYSVVLSSIVIYLIACYSGYVVAKNAQKYKLFHAFILGVLFLGTHFFLNFTYYTRIISAKEISVYPIFFLLLNIIVVVVGGWIYVRNEKNAIRENDHIKKTGQDSISNTIYEKMIMLNPIPFYKWKVSIPAAIILVVILFTMYNILTDASSPLSYKVGKGFVCLIIILIVLSFTSKSNKL